MRLSLSTVVVFLEWFYASAVYVAGPFESTEIRIRSISLHSASLPVIRIGTALTLDCCSKYSRLGRVLRQAYEVFFHWLNSVRGGVLIGGIRYAVELVLLDDKSDKDHVTMITNHLVQNLGIRFLLGPYSSGLTMRAAIVANETGAVLVAPASSNPSVFIGRPSVFGTLTPSTKWMNTIFSMLKMKAVKTVAYFQESDKH